MEEENENSKKESIADLMIKKLRMEEDPDLQTGTLGAIEEKDGVSDEEEGNPSPFQQEAETIPEWLRPTPSMLERPLTGTRRRRPGTGSKQLSAQGDLNHRPNTSMVDSWGLLPPRPGTSVRTRPRPQTSSGRMSSQLDFFGIQKNSDAKKATADHGLRETLQGSLEGDTLLAILESEGRTTTDSLLLASEKGDLSTVQALLAKGVQPNVTGNLDSFTPLHHASNRGHVEVVRALLAAGAEAEVTNRSAETPLHLACYGGHVAVVAALLEAEADVDAKNEYDETPLFYAARKDHSNLVRYLLQRGADNTIRNRFGDLAIDETSDKATQEAFITKEIRERGLAKLEFNNLLVLLSFLDSRDICKCACLSSKWQRASDDSSIWKDRGIQKWNLSLQSALGLEQAPMANMFRPSSSRGSTRSSKSTRKSLSRSSSRGQTPEPQTGTPRRGQTPELKSRKRSNRVQTPELKTRRPTLDHTAESKVKS